MNKLYDFMFHTTDRNFSGMGVLESKNEEQARKYVEEHVRKNRPDVTIRLIRIEPSVGVDKMKVLMQSAGMEFYDLRTNHAK